MYTHTHPVYDKLEFVRQSCSWGFDFYYVRDKGFTTLLCNSEVTANNLAATIKPLEPIPTYSGSY